MPNSILESLNGLTDYLQGENKRLADERQKTLSEISAGNISQAFQSINPDADGASIRKLTYQVIQDAAKMGTLDKSLPLINSLYSDSLRMTATYKKDQQDKALTEYVQKQGVDVPSGISPEAAFKIYGTDLSQQTGMDTYDTSGVSTYKKFDKNGELIWKSIVDARSDKIKNAAEVSKYRGQHPGSNVKFLNEYTAGSNGVPAGIGLVGDKGTGKKYINYGGQLVEYTGPVTSRAKAGGDLTDLKSATELQKSARLGKNDDFVNGNDIAGQVLTTLGLPLNVTATGDKEANSSFEALRSYIEGSPGILQQKMSELDPSVRNQIEAELTRFNIKLESYKQNDADFTRATNFSRDFSLMKKYNTNKNELQSANQLINEISKHPEGSYAKALRAIIKGVTNSPGIYFYGTQQLTDLINGLPREQQIAILKEMYTLKEKNDSINK